MSAPPGADHPAQSGQTMLKPAVHGKRITQSTAADHGSRQDGQL
jgi:hypothetical protein